MVKIAERLRTLRKEKKLRQSDVARLLGIGVRTYQYYEGDDHRPDYEMLIALADLFGVSTDYLLGRSDER
ncbi:helix-turn-helix domain-containing protein [uncultured Oscillibacter sp.]|uniref:helix-turn-helix domain-containing protein n=1 Tax=uncultured Oscillibacter sp. TaxID=876091 RepID=UPI00260D5049|nr:helix-turn-helix transcriptional regulator [uncultured Oscillibacter sp.]